MNDKPTFGSLFAGVGGFDRGFENAGWECLWQVEWDKNCQKVLSYRWPNVVRYSDVQHVEGFNIEPVDVITFGSPCQDLSVAGKRAGLEGSRSSMFYEATRIIREMKYATNGQYPKMAVWENVPGALTSNKGSDFAAVIDEMADIGALAIEWHVLDAQWFGVPQRRRRVFLIACFDPTTAGRCGQQILPIPENGKGDSKQIRKKRKQSARTVENSVGESILYGKVGFGNYKEGNSTFRATSHKRPDENFVLHNVESFVKVIRSGARDEDGNLPPEVWRNEDTSPTLNAFDNTGESRSTVLILDGTRVDDIRIYEDGIVPTLKARMGTGGNQVPMVVSAIGFNTKQDPVSVENLSPTIPSNKGEIGVAIPIQGTIIGRSDTAGPAGRGFGDENDPSYTLDTVSMHAVCTPDLILRRLTPVECERLMGFPDDHTRYGSDGKEISNTNRYKMIGNAVAVPVAQWVASQLKNIIQPI
jgi:DNA (cytosine-5)-methyltransferase 1